jgi:6,7-dimethyl-8-ribityllumazine synthase
MPASMRVSLPLQPQAYGKRVAIVTSRYHDAITGRLADGAVRAFLAAGGREEDVIRADAPGSFELPVIAAAYARRPDIDAVITLGLVLQGETTHDRYICDSVAQAIQDLALETGTPVAFGLLTCQSMEQAEARAGGSHGNKGEEAMNAALLAATAVEGARRVPRGGAR